MKKLIIPMFSLIVLTSCGLTSTTEVEVTPQDSVLTEEVSVDTLPTETTVDSTTFELTPADSTK
jgi:hypothetical protein